MSSIDRAVTTIDESPYLLEARGISKAFPGVQALRNVHLRLRAGEVLAVVGENGAGKSTLMNILAGVLSADGGEVWLDGRELHSHGVHEAQQLGIVLIHQELNLATNLDVAANIFLGREPCRGGPVGLIAGRIYAEARVLMDRLGLDCPAQTLVADLPVGQQQLVEIARALSLRSRILIMDEPTSSLTQRETERLYDVIRELRQEGISILYISHRLKEVETIADRVLVLRDGRNAGELERAHISHDAMVRLMVGRELRQFFQRTHSPAHDTTPPLLRVEGLRITPQPGPPIQFTLRPGEIVGLAGLIGAGRTELAETLFGIRRRLAGEIFLDGRLVALRDPREAIAAGILLVPEDRRQEGLVLAASVRDNISLPSLKRLQRLGLVQQRRERDLAERMCRQLNVKTPSIHQIAGFLSGGNQQKIVLAKWLARTPRLLILDEPTRGIDVGAKTEIYALMDRLASQGLAILMISSDMEEILGMSDRVLVMHEGHLAGELPRAALSEEAIMSLATGGAASS
ncbi:MAG: sugar ABC transporter ATP-binding protein [Gemmataceae bacterium]